MSSGSPTVYLSRAAWEHLDAAQAVVDQHAASATNGICRICRVPDPCPSRSEAAATISRYGQLPRRRPASGAAESAARCAGERGARVNRPESSGEFDRTLSDREFVWFDQGLVGAR